jgi:hypothetical protein
MSNLWCDGFRRYGGVKARMLEGKACAQVDGNWNLASANPRTGTHHARLTDALDSCEFRRVFGAPKSTVMVGMALWLDELPFIEPAIGGTRDGFYVGRFADAANGSQIFIYVGTDGGLVAYRSGPFVGGFFDCTLLGRADPCIVAGAYQHVEIKAIAGNGSAGAIEVRVDEVTRLNLTGIDTVRTANVEFSQIGIGRLSGTCFTGGGHVDLADVFANDSLGSSNNDFIGDHKSFCQMANADTARADFTPSAGASQYGVIDETPPNDGDYLDLAATTGRTDVGFEDLPGNATAVAVARPFVRAKKNDAGTATIKPGIRSGSSVGQGGAQPVTTGFAYYDEAIEVDPATGVPFTPAGLNASFEVIERSS